MQLSDSALGSCPLHTPSEERSKRCVFVVAAQWIEHTKSHLGRRYANGAVHEYLTIHGSPCFDLCCLLPILRTAQRGRQTGYSNHVSQVIPWARGALGSLNACVMVFTPCWGAPRLQKSEGILPDCFHRDVVYWSLPHEVVSAGESGVWSSYKVLYYKQM